MKFYQEVTQWPESIVRNGVYYLNDSKTHMVGFQAAGESTMKKFRSPIRIETRGRKFQLLAMPGEPDSVYFGEPARSTPAPQAITITGSNGNQYSITKHGSTLQCTCSGFQFRRRCKHVGSIKAGSI